MDLSPVRLHPRLATVLGDKERKINFPFISSEQNLACCAETVQVLMGINIHSLTYSILSTPAFCLQRLDVQHRIPLNVMKCQLFLEPVRTK